MSRSNPENFASLIDPLDEIPPESNELLITSGQGRLNTLAKHALKHHTGDRNEYLTLEREQELCTIIQDGQTAQKFLDEVTEGERKRYTKQVRQLEASVAAGAAAEKELFECNIDFARYFARTSMNIGKEKNGEDDGEETSSKPERVGAYGDIRNLRSPYASLEDRTQIALIGLLEAVRKARPNMISKKTKKPPKFITFAAYHIHAALSREALEAENPGAHISVDMRQQISNARKYPEDVPPHKLENIASAYRMAQATPFDTLPSNVYAPEETEDYDDETMLPLSDVIADPYQEPDLAYRREITELREEITRVLSTLSEREAGVVRLRYGLADNVPRTLDEIGQVYGVTRERVRQIERKAMSSLRHPSRSKKLQGYLIDDEAIFPYNGPLNRLEKVESVVNIHHKALSDSDRELGLLEREDLISNAPERAGLESWQASSEDTWDTPVFIPPTNSAEKQDEANKLLISMLQNVDPTDFKQSDNAVAYPKDTIADILITCGKHLRPHHIESYWNNKLESFIDTLKRANRSEFSLNRVTLLFSGLLAETMKDDDEVVELDIPAEIGKKLNYIGAGLRHGKVIVNGDIGNYAGYHMQDLGQLHINGSTGDFTGAYCTHMTSLTVTGNAGKHFAYGASKEATFRVAGEINSLAIMPGFNGEIIAGSIKNKNIALRKAAQNISLANS